MTTTKVSPLLRWALLADALATGATALMLVFFAGALQSLLHVPSDLLFNAGMVLVPYAALVGFLSTRIALPNWVVWAVIGANLLWAIDSVLLLVGQWAEPNALGYTFVIGQAVVVAVFAELQLLGLRRSTRIAA